MSPAKKNVRRKKIKPSPKKRLSKLQIGLLATGLVLLFPLFFVIKWTTELPNYRELERIKLASNIKVMDRNLRYLGTLPVTLPTGVRIDRDIVELQNISPYLPMAIVTSEDRRFFQHYGVDFIGLARGLMKIVMGDRLEGGSTITNQVIKNTLLTELSTGRTLERKFKEWILSVQVERYFSKDEILTDYLNVIYLGSGGYTDLIGVDMAARGYLGKSAKNLSLAESVYIATLIPSARRYFDYPAYRPLMKNLLSRMVEDGRITQQQANAAWKEQIHPAGWQVRYDRDGNLSEAELVNAKAKNLRPNRNTYASHFMQQLENQLKDVLPSNAFTADGGLKVVTTLDQQAQNAIEQSSRNARVPDGATLGAAIVDPYTGDVRAMVGQKLDVFSREWNNAAQSRRQVGSSIKPLLYATAIENGYQQYHTELDAPVNYACAGCPGGNYSPKNFSQTSTGRETTLRSALDQSLNLPTVRLADRIGIDTFKNKLQDLGFEVQGNEGLSLSIGTLESNPLKMALVYASFVNGGQLFTPNYVLKVENSQGQVLYDAENHRSKGKKVWTAQTAFVMWDMLRGVVYDRTGGLARSAQISGRLVGGKTGTTNDVKDLWFVGVTPELAGAVWVGKEEGGAMPVNSYSGVIAAPIWHDMMAGALSGKPYKNIARPAGVTYELHAGYRMAVVHDTPPPAEETAQTPQTQPETQPQTQPETTTEPQTTEETTDPATQDDGTMLVIIDSTTGYLADPSTVLENRLERRIRKEDLDKFVKPEETPEVQPETPEVQPETNPETQPGATVEEVPIDPSTPPSAETIPEETPAEDPGLQNPDQNNLDQPQGQTAPDDLTGTLNQ
ncbi:transglycosylase domain-containing protein [Deinococcus roseus]|uniref:peptidoglycan glycosyltransferase n=1 Tax=Deinococcus roseus TaxID=392414 RepID=A0ABQ2CYZ1_9DEIO|nr:transglycosylase domain-containing protein [Deinococcus roseus]GGJ30127.1 hypothetical protein GCM10008938_15120 [Deinococcus roseus]